MNPSRETTSDDASERALDALLSRARWDSPADDSIDRDRWRAIWNQPHLPWRTLLAAAASVGIVGSIALMRLHSRPTRAESPVAMHRPANISPAPMSRPADAYERLILLQGQAATRRNRPLVAPVPFVNNPPPPRPSTNLPRTARLEIAATGRDLAARRAAFDEMLAVADPADVQLFLTCLLHPRLRDEALARLRACSDPPTSQLLAQFDSPLVAQRLAAARALGAIASPDLSQQLQRMIRSNNHRREALATLIASTRSQPDDRIRQAAGRNLSAEELNGIRKDIHPLF